ncbi:RNA polymerase sigma factor [Haloferula chungangensis]|uniref:RNA polymerase sigma factor n=1 Tax=Haloferula chungangensis TaxID=1048331 RepID=A0ABW2LCP9_9BACT
MPTSLFASPLTPRCFTGVVVKELHAAHESSDNPWNELLAQVRTGDDESARLLVDRLYPRVAAIITPLLPRRSEVEDLAQEVFLRVFEHLDRFRGGSFPAWVSVITRRVCYDALRKQRVRPEWSFSEIDPDRNFEVSATPASQTDFDAPRIIATLFSRMPAEQAWLLREVELREKPISQVAQEMGWTSGAARLRLMRARRKLRQTYDRWNP